MDNFCRISHVKDGLLNMYAKILNNEAVKYPFSMTQLLEENPYTNYGPISNFIELYSLTDTAKSEGSFLVEVLSSPKPTCNEFVENIVYGMPVKQNNIWVETWTTKSLSVEEQQEKFNEASLLIRKERNNLLKECDWTQLPDTPINKEIWASYRQELRNISTQQGFPFNVIWPAPPS